MPTLPNMSLITPTQGGDSGTWDDKINAALALVDAHDHTSGKGVRVPVSGLNINAALSMAGFALTNTGQLAFTAVSALTTGSKVLFVSSADNELYWRSNAGTNVKLTSGSSINTSLVGGFVGDYASVGAQAAFDDANDRYTFKQQSGTNWARLASGSVRIYETGTSESVYVALNTPAALGASYDITFATALPASQVLVQIDASGNLVYSNTIVANASVTVSGTGDFKHGEKKLCQYPGVAHTTSGSGHSFGASAGALNVVVAASASTAFPIYGLRQGMRIKSISVRGTAGSEPTLSSQSLVIQSTTTAAARATTNTGNFVTANRITLTLDVPYTVTGDDEWFYVGIVAGGGSTVVVYGIQVIYDI